MYRDSLFVGIGVLCRNLYRLELSVLPYVSAIFYANIISSTKRLRLNEKSSTLWHKCFGHISKQRMKRLIKDEIILDLDFSNFDIRRGGKIGPTR